MTSRGPRRPHLADVRPIFLSPASSSLPPEAERPAPRSPAELSQNQWLVIAVISTLIVSALLFTKLGAYALWDDEALTALTAESVWQTGDTGAVVGHNIVAYRNGMMLKGLKDRSSPPLQFYWVAPFVGLLGNTSFAARLPMTLLGLGCFWLLLWWLYHDRATVTTTLVFLVSLICNVSFFLFFRQCRYYGPTLLLSVAIAYRYLNLSRTSHVLQLTALLVVMLATNYLFFAAISVCLLVDYLFWGRKSFWITWAQWGILTLTLLVIGLPLLHRWNPMSINRHVEHAHWFADRTKLLWWYLRDMNACEFFATPLMIAAPVVAIVKKETRLCRALIAFAIIYLVTIACSPQAAEAVNGDIRYLIALIPLALMIQTLTVTAIFPRLAIALPIIVACCGTNFLQMTYWNTGPDRPPLGSTLFRYVCELSQHPIDSNTLAADWLKANVRALETVYVDPNFAVYPLMFHAPSPLYCWQLDAALLDHPDYRNLPPAHFRDQLPPDYYVLFGTIVQTGERLSVFGIMYDQQITIAANNPGPARPELIWRRASTTPDPKLLGYGVSILKRSLPSPF